MKYYTVGILLSLPLFVGAYKNITNEPVVISPIPPMTVNASFEPTPTLPPPKTEKELILSQKYGKEIWIQYRLESSRGKNDGCRDKGQFNGFGYAQSKHTWNCFDSFEVVVSKVNAWHEKHSDMALAQRLCYYQSGEIKESCEYYEKYQFVAKEEGI